MNSYKKLDEEGEATKSVEVQQVHVGRLITKTVTFLGLSAGGVALGS